MRKAAGFAASGALLIAGALAVMFLVYPSAEDRRGIVLAALLAFVIQMVSYGVARSRGRGNVFVGWGLGALVRVVALVLFALVLVRLAGIPSSSATLSFALFLFVSTLVEPLFLTP